MPEMADISPEALYKHLNQPGSNGKPALHVKITKYPVSVHEVVFLYSFGYAKFALLGLTVYSVVGGYCVFLVRHFK